MICVRGEDGSMAWPTPKREKEKIVFQLSFKLWNRDGAGIVGEMLLYRVAKLGGRLGRIGRAVIRPCEFWTLSKNRSRELKWKRMTRHCYCVDKSPVQTGVVFGLSPRRTKRVNAFNKWLRVISIKFYSRVLLEGDFVWTIRRRIYWNAHT